MWISKAHKPFFFYYVLAYFSISLARLNLTPLINNILTSASLNVVIHRHMLLYLSPCQLNGIELTMVRGQFQNNFAFLGRFVYQLWLVERYYVLCHRQKLLFQITLHSLPLLLSHSIISGLFHPDVRVFSTWTEWYILSKTIFFETR